MTARMDRVALTRELVHALCDAGMGVRATARILRMSPGHIAYYRDELGIKVPAPPTTDELIDALPVALQARVISFRDEREFMGKP